MAHRREPSPAATGGVTLLRGALAPDTDPEVGVVQLHWAYAGLDNELRATRRLLAREREAARAEILRLRRELASERQARHALESRLGGRR